MIKNTEENIEKLSRYINSREEIEYDIVDLAKVLANINGVDVNISEKNLKLKEDIPSRKHTVFILLDGFGYYKLMSLDESSILKKSIKYKLKTVNPTSTACVLTSLISASYPSDHGIFGWWDYLKEFDLNYYPLLYLDRRNQKSLLDKGIAPDDVYKFDTMFDKYKTLVNVYEDSKIINTEYSKRIAGSATRHGFYSIKQSFDMLVKNLKYENTNTFNYVYFDGLDENSHIYGTNSPQVSKIIKSVEDGIKKLLNETQDVTVILTADHGQVEMTKMLYLNQKTNYLNYFYAMPSMDTRMISFFVKEKFREEFENKFCEEFSEDVILLKKEELTKYNLFGNEKMSKIASDSLGEYVAIVVNDKFMVCDRIVLEDKINTKGNHSGLTKKETEIPLVII